MPKFVVEYRKTRQAARARRPAGWPGLSPQPRRHLVGDRRFPERSRSGDVLELGSGTGQHIAAFARRTPQLTWWPSDIYPSHLASIEAWRRHAGLANLRAPQRIDLADPAWTWTADGQAGGTLAAMLCINVLHISPWRVSQNLIAGAGRLLRDGGRLFVYGPFMRDGAHTAPSNAAFDASLRAENPEWGVRDVARSRTRCAQEAGLTPAEIAADAGQ